MDEGPAWLRRVEIDPLEPITSDQPADRDLARSAPLRQNNRMRLERGPPNPVAARGGLFSGVGYLLSRPCLRLVHEPWVDLESVRKSGEQVSMEIKLALA